MPQANEHKEAMLQAVLDNDIDAQDALIAARNKVTPSRMPDELTDAKIAAAEARTDTKFAQLLARLDATNARLESFDTKLGRIEAEGIRTRSTVRTTGFTVVSIIVAVLGLLFAVFAQSFNLGSKVSEVAHAEALAVLTNVNAAARSAPSTAPESKVPPKNR
jgi:hypothetical protein